MIYAFRISNKKVVITIIFSLRVCLTNIQHSPLWHELWNHFRRLHYIAANFLHYALFTTGLTQQYVPAWSNLVRIRSMIIIIIATVDAASWVDITSFTNLYPPNYIQYQIMNICNWMNLNFRDPDGIYHDSVLGFQKSHDSLL